MPYTPTGLIRPRLCIRLLAYVRQRRGLCHSPHQLAGCPCSGCQMEAPCPEPASGPRPCPRPLRARALWAGPAGRTRRDWCCPSNHGAVAVNRPRGLRSGHREVEQLESLARGPCCLSPSRMRPFSAPSGLTARGGEEGGC